jgi:hypothetical protein
LNLPILGIWCVAVFLLYFEAQLVLSHLQIESVS